MSQTSDRMQSSLKTELETYKNKDKERKEKARLYRIKSDKKRYEGGKTTTQIRDLNTLLMEEVDRLNKQVQKLQLANLYDEEGGATRVSTPSDRMQSLEELENLQLEEFENLRLDLKEARHLKGISDFQLEDFIESLKKPKNTNDKIINIKKILQHIDDNYEELPEIGEYHLNLSDHIYKRNN